MVMLVIFGLLQHIDNFDQRHRRASEIKVPAANFSSKPLTRTYASKSRIIADQICFDQILTDQAGRCAWLDDKTLGRVSTLSGCFSCCWCVIEIAT